MIADPAVLVPLFASLDWPLWLRLVSRDWRYVFDKWCPRASKQQTKKVYCSREEVYAAAEDATMPRWLGLYVSLPRDVTQAELSGINDYGNVHTLDLTWCEGVTDVSALGNVHTLNLWGCTGVTDVSALGGVHTLHLCHCTGVVDVSALGNVHTLNLYRCTGVVDVSALGGVHTLNLRHCFGVRDVSALRGKVKNLNEH